MQQTLPLNEPCVGILRAELAETPEFGIVRPEKEGTGLIAREGAGVVTLALVALFVVFDGAFDARSIVTDTLWDFGFGSAESVLEMIINGIYIGRGTELYWILVGIIGVVIVVVVGMIAKDVRFAVLFEPNGVSFLTCGF